MAGSFLGSQPLSIVVYPSAKDLQNHECADQLVDLVNESFEDSNKDYFSGQRALDLADLINEIGEASFSIVVSSLPDRSAAQPQKPVVYAIASARRFDLANSSPTPDVIWKPRVTKDENWTDIDSWEIKVVCTNPRLKRKGLGYYAMDLLELEIRRRFHELSKSAVGEKLRRLQLVLTTLKEVNEGWYARRGFEIVGQAHVDKDQRLGRLAPRPNHGSFHVATMVKFLSLT